VKKRKKRESEGKEEILFNLVRVFQHLQEIFEKVLLKDRVFSMLTIHDGCEEGGHLFTR
jgi:hypothetical protein